MESKRRRLPAPVQQRNWQPSKTTYCKCLPLSGEGVVSANIERRTTFLIRIRPALQLAICDNKMQTEEADEEADEEGYVEVEISTGGAILKAKKPSGKVEEKGHTKPGGGLEEGKKVSYWFSFNRDARVLKYGKGYIMEQTTLCEFPFEEKEEDPDPWEFIFRPDTTKEIVIKDVASIEALAMLERPNPQSETFFSLSQVDMDRQATEAYCSIHQSEEIRKLRSLVDVEKKVSFYPHPLTKNWSPLILDSSKATLDILSTNFFTMSASLPATCRELYENVSPPGVALDWPYKNPRFSDVINYSIKTDGKILNEKIKEKKDGGEFAEYLRVAVGTDLGSSPGIPYVLEIWPPGAESSIHSHGNAYAVEKVLYGEIKFTIYNKTWHEEETQQELMSFTATQGDVSWMSPNWYQTSLRSWRFWWAGKPGQNEWCSCG